MSYRTYTTYNHKEIEPKWQGVWEEKGIYVPDLKSTQRPFYNLWMFPYPSGEGLHVGHAYASTASDIHGRFKRTQGYNVFQPIGYDSFGIHSENYALKRGERPQLLTERLIDRYRKQLKAMGHGYDWTRTVTTSNPDYYHWTQWIFIQMFKAGLAYRKKALVNFCPKCKTVLADEQVINNQCERCSTLVEKKELEQWFFKITAYAERLLAGLDKIDWSEKIKTAQRNWIGRKEGATIKFRILEDGRWKMDLGKGKLDALKNRKIETSRNQDQENLPSNFKYINVFTTRPETIFGATFIILSPSHPLAGKVKTVINPANGEEIPVFVDEYVLNEVGTGAVMGVPAHDQRDLAFAKKHNLPIIDAPMANKSNLSNFTSSAVIYHFRDWLISRQRYWGPPIPMVYCEACAENHLTGSDPVMAGWYPVPEEKLPVLLPKIDDYQPEGNGKGPLANHPEFYKTKCPQCHGDAVRETDVSDTFLDSAWYELRYPSVGYQDQKLPFDPELTKKWLPVDMYTGGAEHAVLHLMYFRFVTMVLHDLGYLNFDEPAARFFAHGMIIKNGAKMSKSRGNVVNPDEYIAKFGADALRLYLMFMGPVSDGGDFRDDSMKGMRRWVDRVWNYLIEKIDNPGQETEGLAEVNKLVAKAAVDMEKRHYNTVISAMMVFINETINKKVGLKALKKFLIVLAPFAPHLAEELWQRLVDGSCRLATLKLEASSSVISSRPRPLRTPPASGASAYPRAAKNYARRLPSGEFVSIHQQKWPEVEEKGLENEEIIVAVTVNGKMRATLKFSADEAGALEEKEIVEKAKNDERVKKYLAGQEIKKTVYVSGRIVNFVV